MKYTALLRGINVGKNKYVNMKELQQWCAELGWQEVQTYIQSGNVVFRLPGDSLAGTLAPGARSALEEQLEQSLMAHLGFEVPVLILSESELFTIISGNPFPHRTDLDDTQLVVTLFKDQPRPDANERLVKYLADTEEYRLIGQVIYLCCPAGYGHSKMNPANVERACGTRSTTRNWRTMKTLLGMLQS